IVRKRCHGMHGKDMCRSVPVFASPPLGIREILWVWKRKVIRRSTARVRLPTSITTRSLLVGSIAVHTQDGVRSRRLITPSLPILPQGEQFPMVIAFLPYYVATIKLAYISIFP